MSYYQNRKEGFENPTIMGLTNHMKTELIVAKIGCSPTEFEVMMAVVYFESCLYWDKLLWLNLWCDFCVNTHVQVYVNVINLFKETVVCKK
jgi:hypothetical protein